MLLLATSPGGRGGKTVLEIATSKFRYMNKNTVASFSLPSFNKNFNPESGILDECLNAEFEAQLDEFVKSL